MGKGKKARKRDDDDDWENDLEEIAKEAGIDLHHQEDYVAPVIAKKEKKKKNKKESLAENNDDIMDQDAVVSSKQKASFQALMMDDGSDDDDNASDDESEEEIVQEKVEKPSKQTTKKGKDKKKGKTVTAGDEDIDAICAEFELNNVESTKGKKGKKKNKKNDTELEIDTLADEIEGVTINDDENDDEKENSEDTEAEKISEPSKDVKKEADDEDDGPKMKTAAQKKAEKKERENKKKEARRVQKQKEKEKQDKEEPTKESENEKKNEIIDSNEKNDTPEVAAQMDTEIKQDVEVEAAASGSDNEGDEDEGTKSKDKKKKKKKKKKEEDDSSKKKKGKKMMNKAAILQVQEALEMVKQEEERLRLEEEEKAKAFEDAEDKRLEKLRMDQEKKDRKKQKDKEKKDRLRKEGKLLTPAQKEQKRRAEKMLEAMRQQGIQVPTRDAGEQKKVKYVTRKPNKKQQQQQQPEESKEDVAAKVEEGTETNEAKTEVIVPTIDVAKKEPEEVEEKEDLPDSWDLDSDDEKEKENDATKEKVEESAKVEESTTEKSSDVDATNGKVAVEKSTEESSSGETDSEGSSGSVSDTEDESESSDSESEEDNKTRQPVERVKESISTRIIKRRVAAEKNRTQDRLRAPVICVLGHVDTGKTKILDKIRHTNVQDGEAGGITQQIGATMVPVDAVKVQTKMVKEFQSFDLRLPGLLIIDTPGHESFSNLRSRGSNLCDMAILVVDIMHGLEPQTIESINLLRKKHTPFVVALNKVDRLFEWKRSPATQFEDTMRKQKKNTKLEFEERTQIVINELAEQGLNSALFYKNTNEKSYISLVPTSAHSGDGMGDLMAMICKLTQTRLAEKLAYSAFLESTVMEVKSLPGLGTTIDVILVNGKLKEGDTIITGGIEGPIVTQIRSVLTPQPMRELRVKSQYIHHTEIEAAQGVKLCGKDLERAIAGSPLFVAEQPDEIEYFKHEVAEITKQSLNAIKVSERGVYVQASTLGSLEALLEFLKTSKIPYCGVNIGPVHKRDIMRASVMLEHNAMYAVILAFDVKVEKDAQDIADKEGVKVFTADIIYHLFDKFTAFTSDYKQKKRDEFKHIAVFPCKLRVLPQHIYNSRDPIVIGVNVEAGSLRLGTALTVPCKEFCDIGVVTGIEGNHKQLEKAMPGQEVSIKIEPTGEAPRMYGRHFTHEDMIMSKISRDGIDALKNYFREEMTKQDWQLLIEMKKIFEIM